MEAKTKDLRIKSKEIVETILRGEEVSLTYRGKAIATIVPLKRTKQEEIPPIFGMWADRKESADVEKYVRKKRKGRTINAR